MEPRADRCGAAPEFPDQPERHLAPETIYQAVYRPELGGLCRELAAALRRSLAWDQGTEMALHTEVAAALGMPVDRRRRA